MFNSLEELDKEIARLEAILARGPKPGRLWTPHLIRGSIAGYRKSRLRFTWPRVYLFRVWLRELFLKLANIAWL